MKKFLVLASLVLASVTVFAQEKNDWRVRLRVTEVVPQESSSISTIGGNVEVASQTIPELDFTYFMFKNFSANLILGTSKHAIEAKNTSLGDVAIGSIRLLPPTLTFLYHLPVSKQVQPYVGGGVNYTMFFDSKNAAAIANTSYKNNFAPAAQLGVDFDVAKKIFLNFDVKKIWLKTDATVTTIPSVANGATVIANTKINPWLLSFGVGIKL